MFYYEVAPITHLATGNGILTYSSEVEIPIGTFVLVPLRNGQKTAVVIRNCEKPSYKTKPIAEVIPSIPALNYKRLELADFIAKEYYCNLGEAISALNPVDYSKKRRVIETTVPNPVKDSHKTLTKEQQGIFDEISLDNEDKPHLIFGVTGSGKTEIYLQLVQAALNDGKGAIILVPEISLTPQTEQRFLSRFGDNVALLHSGMKETEKFNQWQQIQQGLKKIVIGPRSALFAPLDEIGIIIIDECHENTYKQDSTPRYQAVSVAEKLSALYGCKLILGSATPTVEQLFAAESKRYKLHTLNNRIVQTSMPVVEIVDMRNEYHYGNKSIFSEKLQQEIRDTLARQKQVLLFINRRGMSTFVSCRDCGYVANCPDCEVPYTFHYDTMQLVCHHCSKTASPPVTCPECKSMAIKFFGAGTEKVEHELRKLVGNKPKIVRMDQDTTRKTGSHALLFEQIRSGEADIVIGTQMIAKGWDIENIDLIGIVAADGMLNLPSYDSEEKAFALLTQVAGRAGRGEHPGKVILQTYKPDQPVFDKLRAYDYLGYYKKSLAERRELCYPPFAKLINLLYNNANFEAASIEAKRLATKLASDFKELNLEVAIVGPAPSFISKVAGKYRWQITLKIPSWNTAKQDILYKYFIQTNLKEWVIDADPNGI